MRSPAAFQNIEGAELAARGVHPVIFPVDHHGVPAYDELVVVANSQRLASDPAYRRRGAARSSAALAAGTAYAKPPPRLRPSR